MTVPSRGYAAGMADQAAAEEMEFPPYVTSVVDRERWTNARKVAAAALDAPEDSAVVWQATRDIFNDRETYPS